MSSVRVGSNAGSVVVARPSIEDKLARKLGDTNAAEIVRDARDRARDRKHYQYLLCVALAAKESP